jgi:sulfotransferase family protein
LTPADAGRRPILVTGAHRSGTTWAGRLLAASPTPVGYLWEPFNPRHRPGTFPIRFPHYFHYVCAENAAEVRAPLADALAFRYRPGAELRSLRSVRDAARMGRDWWRSAGHRRRGVTPLMKDPIALFSSEWLADTFGMRVLVMIRHPAPFAATLRRRGWRHRFADFLDQPLLMRDHLAPFEAEIRAAAERRPDILDEAILLWNILYATVDRLRERRPEWAFARHEDLSTDPVGGFRDLYSALGLEWDAGVERFVRQTTDASNPTEVERADSIRRSSAAHAGAWRTSMTAADIERIRAGTAAVAGRFYSDSDWPPPAASRS